MTQPPMTGPTMGAMITPMPQRAMAMPRSSHREGLQQDGLGDGLQGAAAEALDDAEDDEFAQAGGGAAKHGADGEQNQADKQETLAPEPEGEPAGDGQDDGVGDQVGGEHPGGFVD